MAQILKGSQKDLEIAKIVNHVIKDIGADLASDNKTRRETVGDKYGRIEKMGVRHVGSITPEIFEAVNRIDPTIFKDKKKTLQFLKQFAVFKTAEKL